MTDRPLIEVSMASQQRGGAGYGTALKLAAAGELPGVVRMGRVWRVKPEAFEDAVARLVAASPSAIAGAGARRHAGAEVRPIPRGEA